MSTEVDENKVREKAYEIWIERGQPVGTALQDWLEAKRILMPPRNKYGLREIRTEAGL